MNKLLYPKLAWQNLRKNGKFYFPYLLTIIGTAAAFYIMMALGDAQDLPAGAKIPSVRELAAEAGVNPNTMQKALTELEQLGLLNTQRTNGRYVTEDTSLIATTRRQLAWDKVIAFLREMEALGFTNEACIQLMEESRNHG